MCIRLTILAGWLIMASVVAICLGAGVAQTVNAGDNTHGADHDMTHEDHHEEGATHAMSVAHAHMGPHMKWTTRRSLTADDGHGRTRSSAPCERRLPNIRIIAPPSK